MKVNAELTGMRKFLASGRSGQARHSNRAEFSGERAMSRFCKRTLVLVALLGLVLGSATEAQAYLFWGWRTGAQLTAVLPYSPARRVGLEAGDTIVAIDGLPVRTPDDFTALTAFKRHVMLTIRDGRTGTYVWTDTPVVNGRIGVRFVIVAW
jgi:predicted metalloprotease with PDZ domain